MAHMKVYQSSTSARAARLPGKNNTVMGSDALAGVRIVNLRDLPTETRAGGKQQEAEDYRFLTTGWDCTESSHREFQKGSDRAQRSRSATAAVELTAPASLPHPRKPRGRRLASSGWVGHVIIVRMRPPQTRLPHRSAAFASEKAASSAIAPRQLLPYLPGTPCRDGASHQGPLLTVRE